MSDTEFRLGAWRDGSTQAERLAAAILAISGYENIDPQAPLGGPDGRRDIQCTKGGLTWIGAVFFPPTPNQLGAIKKKFSHDLDGAVSHGRDGLVFITNQSVSPKQRDALSKLAREKGRELDLFHLERLRAALDSPSGYGVRVQFLRTPLNLEEQLSWFAESGTRLDAAIGANTRELHDLKAKIDQVMHGQEDVSRTLRMVAGTSGVDFVSPLQTQDLLSSSRFVADSTDGAVSALIDASLLRAFHRLTCFDLPSRVVGHFRTGRIRVGRGTDYVNKTFEPPGPSEVAKLIDQLCSNWRSEFDKLRGDANRAKLTSVARFHANLLSIHPFDDGNGRLARAVLMQQCLDLFGKADMSLMDKGGNYYSALEAADKGDFMPLEKVISDIIK